MAVSVLLICCLLAACGRETAPSSPTPATALQPAPVAAASADTAQPAYVGATYAPVPGRTQPSAAQLTEIGRRIFFDSSLSASGKASCASCHDPQHAWGPPNALSVQLGGADGRQEGPRATPSLRYLQTLTAFTEHHHDNDGDDSIDAGPTGGHMWDGRAGSAHEQAGMPLLSPAGMANVLSEDKRQQVLGLGRLGWSLRRIESATGVRRETAGGYRGDTPDGAPTAGWMRPLAKRAPPSEQKYRYPHRSPKR